MQLILCYVNKRYRRVDVNQVRGEAQRPEFINVNPIGKFPAVLLGNGDILSESNAILFYFAKGTSLWPEETRMQAEVLRWLFFEQYSHELTLSVIRYLNHYDEHPRRHKEQIETLKPKACDALEVLEKQLQSHQWVASEVCTVADYALYPYTRVANESGFNLANYPSIERWLSRIEVQPNFLPMGAEGAEEVLNFSEYFQPNV